MHEGAGGPDDPFARVRDQAARLWHWLRHSRAARAAVVLASGVGALVLLVAAVTFVWIYRGTSVPANVTSHPTTVVDASGRPLGLLAAGTYDAVEAADLPAHVRHAVLAAEDRSFHRHRGVSLGGSLRALWANVTAGRIEQGGSTITQQYVGAIAFGDRVGYGEKLREAIMAMKLERRLGKDEILQRYLNRIYFGRGAHGIGAAARTYFQREVIDLSPNQAATLAALIARPTALDPETAPEELDRRRIYVLEGMAEEGWLERREGQRLIGVGLPDIAAPGPPPARLGDYYLDAVRDELVEVLGTEYVAAGYQVTVEMNLEVQRVAEEVLGDHLEDAGYTGAIVSIDPRDGGVRALVGGPGIHEQPMNTAVDAARQAGSAFKPFTLATFLEQAYSPDSTFDAPASLEIDTGQGPHEVHNYGDAEYGTQTVEEATRTSTNTVYIQLAEEVGPEAVVDLARRTGIAEELPAVKSISLGAGSVTPLSLATAYATFAADGVRNGPRFIKEVRRHDGTVVYRGEPAGEKAVGTNVARLVTELLTGVIESGTGTAADIGRPAAGKTGTTDEHRDAWFAGYTPQLATVVWYGHPDNASLGYMAGGDDPAETWAEFMVAALDGAPILEFPYGDDSDLHALDRAEADDEPAFLPDDGGGTDKGDGDEGSGEGRGEGKGKDKDGD